MKLPSLLYFATTALAACNGHDELCSRKYSEVTFVGSHDAAFVGDLPTHNQYVSVPDQLKLGVRFFEVQTHKNGNSIELCHTYCWELDAGPLTGFLKDIADFMNSNPTEVVSLIVTNQDAIPMDQFDAAFESSGLKKLVYHPPKTVMTKDEWPTLQQLIDAGTRAIVFMDYNADQSQVDYIIPEFDYFWETPYGVTDKNFNTCAVDRPANGDPNKLMGLMNHMLNFKIGDVVFPDQVDTATVNSLDSINKQVNLCKSQGKPQPNVVLLDWINIGEAQQAQLSLNGLS